MQLLQVQLMLTAVHQTNFSQAEASKPAVEQFFTFNCLHGGVDQVNHNATLTQVKN